MPRLGRRLGPPLGAGLAATVLAVAVAVLPASGPASAVAALDACGTSSGVTVVVDFRALGGGIVTACSPGDPATGLAALTAAGFGVAGTTRWGLAFVCRINGQPTAATEPCDNTPPSNAFWSYWHASRGGNWSFSSLGAASYDPPAGSVEGWSFGSGDAPRSAPPAAPAPPPADPPAPPPPAGSGSGSGSGGGGAGGGSGGVADPSASPESTVDSSPSVGGSPSPSAPSSATSSPATSIYRAGPVGRQPTGSATGTLVGVGLVALIAAAAGVIGFRRRMRAQPAADLPPDNALERP